MNLSKYGFPYLGDGSEKWRSYPHIVPKNLDAIALAGIRKFYFRTAIFSPEVGANLSVRLGRHPGSPGQTLRFAWADTQVCPYTAIRRERKIGA
jgi:hypothetical protein